MKIPVAKEGILYCIIPMILGIVALFLGFWILSIVFIFVSSSVILFFRYPDRIAVGSENLIYAPADGKIIHIGDENEDNFFKDVVHRISIFMSLFSVHINYASISGIVKFIQYTPGRFTRADIIDIKENNENNFIGISNDFVRVGVRQVAGWIARRIVCNCKIGDKVLAGEKFGLIKFGSRIDVYFPRDYDVCVRINECVRAGRTVLGRRV